MHIVTVVDTVTHETSTHRLDITPGSILGSLPFRLVGKHAVQGLNALAQRALDSAISDWANKVHKMVCEETGEDPESMTIIACELHLSRSNTGGFLVITIQDNECPDLLSVMTVVL